MVVPVQCVSERFRFLEMLSASFDSSYRTNLFHQTYQTCAGLKWLARTAGGYHGAYWLHLLLHLCRTTHSPLTRMLKAVISCCPCLSMYIILLPVSWICESCGFYQTRIRCSWQNESFRKPFFPLLSVSPWSSVLHVPIGMGASHFRISIIAMGTLLFCLPCWKLSWLSFCRLSRSGQTFVLTDPLLS